MSPDSRLLPVFRHVYLTGSEQNHIILYFVSGGGPESWLNIDYSSSETTIQNNVGKKRCKGLRMTYICDWLVWKRVPVTTSFNLFHHSDHFPQPAYWETGLTVALWVTGSSTKTKGMLLQDSVLLCFKVELEGLRSSPQRWPLTDLQHVRQVCAPVTQDAMTDFQRPFLCIENVKAF